MFGCSATKSCVSAWRSPDCAASKRSSETRAKAVTRGINDRCRALRPYAETLVEGFGIPEALRYAEMLHPENLSD